MAEISTQVAIAAAVAVVAVVRIVGCAVGVEEGVECVGEAVRLEASSRVRPQLAARVLRTIQTCTTKANI